MQSRPSYLSEFLFHDWVKYMLQLVMWTPRLDKVACTIVHVSLFNEQNTLVAFLR